MSSNDERILAAKELVEHIPDFPKKDISFHNIFPILRNPKIFQGLMGVIIDDVRINCPNVEVVVGLDSRGFLFGPVIAQALDIAFVPVRKKGKLPGKVHKVSYTLDYGEDVFELQQNSIQSGQKVIIVDDLVGSGGTMKAARDLMDASGAETLACFAIIGPGVPDYLNDGPNDLKCPLYTYMHF